MCRRKNRDSLMNSWSTMTRQGRQCRTWGKNCGGILSYMCILRIRGFLGKYSFLIITWKSLTHMYFQTKLPIVALIFYFIDGWVLKLSKKLVSFTETTKFCAFIKVKTAHFPEFFFDFPEPYTLLFWKQQYTYLR